MRKTIVVVILIGVWTTLSVHKDNTSHFVEVSIGRDTGNEDYLINTAGCSIPNYQKTMVFNESSRLPINCGPRLIFVQVLNSDKLLIKFNKTKVMKIFQNAPVYCCYSFASRSQTAGEEDTKIQYTKCKWFLLQSTSTIPFETEYLKLVCKTKKRNLKKYKDHYALLKGKNNYINVTPAKSFQSYSVLVFGIDTISRARMFHSMPRTVKYLLSNGWIDYKGYQKVAYNTFPNVMAVLTGKKMSTVYKECEDGCNHILLWKKFQDSGYVTAYGEDYLSLPDTFSNYKGFLIPPTDHYMRPFFLLGEENMGNFVCSGKVSSGVHVLNYAGDFAKTYKDQNMFGWFWINSFSHNSKNLPSLYDSETHDLFKRLNKEGVFENTFIILLSDHGMRFGKMRRVKESYYAERLPLLFIWVPHKFRRSHPSFYHSLIANRHRLTNPYDIHMTLQDILNISNNSFKIEESEACPLCSSLFLEKSPNRTCANAAIDEKWCACHDLKYPLDKKELQSAISTAVSAINYISNSVKTKPCTACARFKLKKVLRNHTYKSGNFSYYVIAFTVVPGNIAFEATVRTNGNEFETLSPTHAIDPITPQNCVIISWEAQFCFCIETKCK